MARFTPIERKLIDDYVSDDTLHTSLSKIRECMEELWRPDAPRIVQDFTDHGEKHSERLVGFADQLLQANKGKKLQQYEMFLLLAGIYLHDIGNQCDVVKFPEIREEAEKLGAKFELNFNANTASSYSIKEQNSIRENHQYLSAAWISYAFDRGQTVVSNAVKGIHNNLILDLMDICMYHSKLTITDCSDTFKLNPNMRKKLVATILRFSDELDIASNRVSIETVKNFSFNPHNSLYFCIHNLTLINFIKNAFVQIQITLNPEDYELYGELIKLEFIDKFKSKNEKLLDILAEEGISIRITSDSKVVEYKFAEKLPTDVIHILEEIQLEQQQKQLQEKQQRKQQQEQQLNDEYLGTLESSINANKSVFVKLYIGIKKEAENTLKKLIENMRLSNVRPVESFAMSIPMLRNLTEGDKVIAVSFWKEREWENSSIWDSYTDANLIAANNGAIVKRIFITDKELLDDLRNNHFVKIHMEKQFNYMSSYFLNIEMYNSFNLDVKSWIGEGFFLIKSSSTQEEMAVLDNFYHGSRPECLDYRTTITFNPNDLLGIENAFYTILTQSIQMTKKDY